MTNMNQDYPQLTLDDLVHLMSPSPAPQALLDDSDVPPRANSASPEPIPESDIVQMRRKVAEMRHVDKTDAQLTAREKELAEMVLRLSAVARPDSGQLLRQADTISALIQQRDLLLYQAQEQCLRWSSEKDGWARMVEALLAQQAKIRLSADRDEDYERLHAAETDNKSLRQRLNETQSRLQILESELSRLRPLLLMQPLISRSPLPPPTPNSKTQFARRRRKDVATTEDEEHGASEDEPLIGSLETPPQASHSQATPRAKPRKSEALNNAHPSTNSHKRRVSQKAISRGLSADARVEHLLLAARSIGKHRAGIASGMVQHLEERERERKREESGTTAVATTPKTPKRNMPYAGYPSESGYIYVNGQMRPGPGMQPVPLFVPAYPHHLLQTPSSSTTAPSIASSTQKSKQLARSNNPPTPLDSLLSAARSMMNDDADAEADEDEEVDIVGGSPGNTVVTRNTRARDTFGSPVPKRRRVVLRTDKFSATHDLTSRATNASASSMDASGDTSGGLGGRVKSALDVLADQAAAFSTQEQLIASPQTRTQTKDKGKVRVDTQPRSNSTPKSGKTKLDKKEPEADVPSSVAPTSRSVTPRSDLADNPTGSTPITATGGSASEVLVDPGGGTNSASVLNPSLSQTLDSTLVSEEDLVTTCNDARSPQSPATPASQIDDPADATPRQGARIQAIQSEDDIRTTTARLSPVPAPARPTPGHECCEALPLQQRSGTTPPGGENSGSSDLHVDPTVSTAPPKNKELIRVAEQDVPALTPSVKRQRSPYVKWSKEEDDLLAQAVAKYGQKWDLVQKALPSRGYHQVRQRWLRKLGVFDSKPDLSSFQTAAVTYSSTSRGNDGEPRGNPKLGLAPLSSEKAFSGLARGSPSMPS